MIEEPDFQVDKDEVAQDNTDNERSSSRQSNTSNEGKSQKSENNSSKLEESSVIESSNNSSTLQMPRIKETIQNKIIRPNSPLYSSSRRSQKFGSESGRSSSACTDYSSSSRNEPRKQNAQTSPLSMRSTDSSSSKDERVVAYKQLIENHKKPPIQLAAPVQQMLHRSFVNALKNQDYNEGIKISNAIKINSALMEEDYMNQLLQSRNDTYKARLDAAQSKLDQKRKEWDELIQQFHTEQNQLREALNVKHQEDEIEFERQWSDASNFKEFNKPSPGLIGIRRIQKELAMTGEFEDALQVKQIADGIKERETEDAEQRALVAMLTAHDRLEEQHKKEILCFEERQRKTELYINSVQYNDIHPLEMLIKQLQNHLNASKPPNMAPIKPKFVSTARARSAVCESFTLPPKDKKTTLEMNDFRFNNEPERLELNGFDVRKLMKRPKSTMKACIRRK